jgi:MEMO1 family protein
MNRILRITAVVGGMAVALSMTACRAEESMSKDDAKIVRKARGAGRWFPASGKELDKMVSGYIDDAKVPEVKGRIVAGIAPHAGFIYSGKVAGYTYRALRDAIASSQTVDTVVVLGFTHGMSYPGVALMDGDAIETPIGRTELDKEAAQILTNSSSRIFFNYEPHATEHSAENEIPFIQKAAPKVKLVVGLIGDHNMKTLDELKAALLELGKKKQIVVFASTDMLHDPDYDLVTKTDKATLKLVEAMDHAGLAGKWSGANQFVCGIGPVLTVIRYSEALGCKKATALFYRNSGDDFPDSRGQYVVGYGSVVFVVEK